MKTLLQLEARWNELLSKDKKSASEIVEIQNLGEQLNQKLTEEYSDFIDELLEIGIKVDSVWDFRNTNETYAEAIPLLLKYLPKVKHQKNKTGFVRALSVKEAKGIATEPLLREYDLVNESSGSLKWTIGNAIYCVITKDQIQKIFPVVLDSSNGESREMLVEALIKFKSNEIWDVLEKLMSDESEMVKAKAEKGLRRYR